MHTHLITKYTRRSISMIVNLEELSKNSKSASDSH